MKNVSEVLNKIHNMDIYELLRKLPDKTIDCVYSDIDYNRGIVYKGKSYTKKFDHYISDYISLASESLRVVKDTGSLFFINYPRNNAFLWANFLDSACFDVQEYVWVYRSNIGHSPNRFTTAHRSILHARKTKYSVFYKDNVAEPYVNQTDKRIRKRISSGSKGRSPYSWFYADLVKNVSKKYKHIDHPCVIPDSVSSRLIQSVTSPKNIVLILFAGSGSEIDVCRKLDRQWISAEVDKNYCDQINKRLDSKVLSFGGA